MRDRKWRENGMQGDWMDYDSDMESINCCQLNVHKARIRESRSQYHNHPEKRLFHRRSCTDMLCLLVFAGCLAAWIFLGYYAISSTPPEAFLAPTDSNNRRCGFDMDVKNKPYVFFFDLRRCLPPEGNILNCDTTKVCVSECPRSSFHLNTFLDRRNMYEIRDRLICRDGFDKSRIYDRDTARRAVRNQDCAENYLESRPIYRRCLYEGFHLYHSKLPDIHNTNETKLTESHVLSDLILSCVLRFFTDSRHVYQALRNIADGAETFGRDIERTVGGVIGNENIEQMIGDISEFGHAVFEDLKMIWPWILVHFCIAAVISFFYITVMRWISGLMVWLSIIASISLLAFSSYYTFAKYTELSEYEKTYGYRTYREPRNLAVELLQRKETWLVFCILSVVLLLFIVITIVFLRSRISLAIQLIKEGSKAVASSWSAIIFPIFPWIIQLAVIAYAVIIFAYVMNFGVPVKKVVKWNGSIECVCRNGYKEGSFCEENIFASECRAVGTNGPCSTLKCMFSDKETQKHAVYLHLYNLFMFLWSLFFASGFGQMVLASAFATYYWTFNKNDLPVFMVALSVWRVLRYHLGTVSLGSFLLALLNWVRILMEYAYNYMNKYDNWFVKAVRCFCSCFCWCLNSFLKFLNKNAYIMCAIHGKGFCTSARDAFGLIVRNMIRVAVLDRVTNLLLLLGKVTVTAALSLLAYYFFSRPVPPIEDPFKGTRYTVEYFFVPIIIVCIVTYFISSLFFGVYSMAVDTLFLCALEDLETNDGSPEKPYYMSKDLMKILHKRNKAKIK